MNTPAWLQGMVLLVWGTTLGLGLPGALLGGLLGALRSFAGSGTVSLNLGERGLTRSVNVTVLLVVATLSGLLAAQGLPKGLLTTMSWLPASLLPLLLVASLNETPLRLRHLALSLRRSTTPEAGKVVQPDAPYLAITLLASAVAAKPAAWTFWLLGGTLATWLWFARPPPRRHGLTLFVGAATLALGIAFFAGLGLQRAQLALQEWGVDMLSGVDSDPYQSQTRIGDLGRVKLSEGIVWRVQQTPPIEVPLLLRTGVFTTYVNGIWMAQRDGFAPLSDSAAPAPTRLLVRGNSHQGSALLPVPANADRIRSVGQLARNRLGVTRVSEAPPLLEISIGRSSVPTALPSAADLSLPPGFTGLLEKLPELAALKQIGQVQQLAGLEAWFAENFRYTLFIGDEAKGRRDLERFLISERAGHCEYFATATVVLLRALGIPARYVTGYSMQDYSSLEQAFVIRKRHAHAWADAFVDGRWIEVDTTPETWLTVEENAAPWWTPAQDLASFTLHRIGEWRRELFDADRSFAGGVAAALLVLAVAWLSRQRLRRPARARSRVDAGGTATAPSAEVLSFRALERQLAELGLGRQASEAPRNWLARLAREGRSVLDPARLTEARQVIDALYQQRYALEEKADKQ